jgi:intracellular sulfur oxidation DsrE/DsrF family protein
MRTKIEDFLRELNTEIDVLDYVDVNNIDPANPFESICEMIDDNGGFDIEMIYYSNAIYFLVKNDPSLTESLEIAKEYGYDVQNLNSEILASLLASKLTREEFYELESEINDFFEKLEEEKKENKNPRVGQFVYDVYYCKRRKVQAISGKLYFIGSEHEPVFRNEFIFPLPKNND